MSLVLEGVALSLGGRPLLKGVSLALEPGEVVGLLGPNGAGKTTTFNLVTGLLKPDRGRVLLDGQRVERLAMPERARMGIGYLPQEPSVFRQLSVRQNLQLALQQSGAPLAGRRSAGLPAVRGRAAALRSGPRPGGGRSRPALPAAG
jgi:lipopolysaccharide export system ATP-binding protein